MKYRCRKERSGAKAVLFMRPCIGKDSFYRTEAKIFVKKIVYEFARDKTNIRLNKRQVSYTCDESHIFIISVRDWVIN